MGDLYVIFNTIFMVRLVRRSLVYCTGLMKRLILVIAFVFLAGIGRVWASDRIGFQMYSWKAGSEWRYAVLEGSATVRSAEQIRSSKNRLKNLTFLKGRLAGLPASETVYWRVEPQRGFIEPSQEIIHEIKEYADGLQLRVLLPGDPNIEDPMEKVLQVH